MQDLDTAPVTELIRRALDSSFEDEESEGNSKSIAAWEAVHALARRADGQVVEAAADLLASDDCRQRVRGADIFGQFPEGDGWTSGSPC